jgi:hypothetical protein
MAMDKKNRIATAMRSKWPGQRTAEGINFSHAATALGVTRQAIMGWLRTPDIDIMSSHMTALSIATGYSREWLETGTGPEKLSTYKARLSAGHQIQEHIDNTQKIKIVKWSQLSNILTCT